MAEETKPNRAVSDIQKEYSELCTRAGHLNYQLFTLNKDLDLINERLRNLNFEAAESASKQSETKEEKKSDETAS